MPPSSKTRRPPSPPHDPDAPSGRASLLDSKPLAGHFVHGEVVEVVIVALRKGQYRLEVLLAWKVERLPYRLRSGEPRIFGSVDACLRIIKVAGVGPVPIRIELKTSPSGRVVGMCAAYRRCFAQSFTWKRAARLAAGLTALAAPAWAGPFDAGANALQTQILTVLTPVAIIAVMAMGVAAWIGRITWTWAVSGIIGIVLVFGSPQVVGWVRGMFGV